jgi:ElaB/YqjD/DUF883 family membrane-anchored ribosome-binding protein
MRESPINRLEHLWTPPQAGEAELAESANWKEKLKTWEEDLHTYVGNHPRAALATAVAVGLLLGWMVKRR